MYKYIIYIILTLLVYSQGNIQIAFTIANKTKLWSVIIKVIAVEFYQVYYVWYLWIFLLFIQIRNSLFFFEKNQPIQTGSFYTSVHTVETLFWRMGRLGWRSLVQPKRSFKTPASHKTLKPNFGENNWVGAESFAALQWVCISINFIQFSWLRYL